MWTASTYGKQQRRQDRIWMGQPPEKKKQGYSKATKQQSSVISKALRSDSITHDRM